jgi:N-acylneuraminate cytidylyltransferase
MIGSLRVLALIPARGGSKGLPGKNVRPLAGKPLIAWSVAAARASRFIDRIVVSSDDAAIIQAAVEAGAEAPFIRPPELARDDTPSQPVILHALDTIAEQFDLVVLLQPTSPLRTAADIDACVEKVVTGAPACISVVAPAKSPWWMYRMDASGHLAPLMDGPAATRRQDLPAVVAPNGAVYVARVPWLRANGGFVGPGTVGYQMPADRSVDIDDALDLKLAELILAGEGG